MQNIYEVYFPGYLIININTSLLLYEMISEPTCSMQNEIFSRYDFEDRMQKQCFFSPFFTRN